MITPGKLFGVGAALAGVLSLLLIQAPRSEAQNYRGVIYQQSPYVYQQPYQPYVHKEYVKEYVPIAIPSAYPVVAVPVYSYVNAPGYYPAAAYGSVLQQPQQPVDADKVAELVLQKLERRLKLLQDQQQGGGQQGGDGGPPMIVKPQARNNDPVGVRAKVLTLFQNKCAICHGTSSPGGGITLIDGGRLTNLTSEARIQVYDAVYEGRMPKGGQALSDQDVEVVRLWLKQK